IPELSDSNDQCVRWESAVPGDRGSLQLSDRSALHGQTRGKRQGGSGRKGHSLVPCGRSSPAYDRHAGRCRGGFGGWRNRFDMRPHNNELRKTSVCAQSFRELRDGAYDSAVLTLGEGDDLTLTSLRATVSSRNHYIGRWLDKCYRPGDDSPFVNSCGTYTEVSFLCQPMTLHSWVEHGPASLVLPDRSVESLTSAYSLGESALEAAR